MSAIGPEADLIIVWLIAREQKGRFAAISCAWRFPISGLCAELSLSMSLLRGLTPAAKIPFQTRRRRACAAVGLHLSDHSDERDQHRLDDDEDASEDDYVDETSLTE